MGQRGRRFVHLSMCIVAGVLAPGPRAARIEGHQARTSAASVEIEDLVNAVAASGGQVARQDMQGFGQGWSGAQLFWRAPAPIDSPVRNWPHLDFSFSVPADAKYEIVLRHTVAPDFATFRVFLDGQAVADVEGYAPSVAPRARSLGATMLKAGSHQIVITVMSKAAASKGYAVGLDRLDLRPASATDSTTLSGNAAGAASLAGTIANAPIATSVTLDAGRRLADVAPPPSAARLGLDASARIAATRALGGVFANVHEVVSTLRWSADAPVIAGRGLMGGQDVFLGAPEPLTIALRANGKSNVRLVAKALGPDLHLLTCALRVKPGTTLIVHQIGPAAQAPTPVPSSKLMEVTPATNPDDPYYLLAAFQVPAPGAYAFLISATSGKGVNEATNYVEVSYCELSLMK